MGVLYKIEKVEVGKDAGNAVELTGVSDITWSDSDPYVPIEIPGAVTVEIFQKVKPNKVEGTIFAYDFASIRTVFYETDIQTTAGNQYAVTEAGDRNWIGYFLAQGKDSAGVNRKFSFVKMRIRNIEWPRQSKEPTTKPDPIAIHFYAEQVNLVA